MLRRLTLPVMLCFFCCRIPGLAAVEAPEEVAQRLIIAVRDNTLPQFYQSLSQQEHDFLESRWSELQQRVARRYHHQFNATLLLLHNNQEAQLLEQILKHILSYVQSGSQADLQHSLLAFLQPFMSDNPQLKDLIQPLSAFLYKDLVITKEQLQISSSTLQKHLSQLNFKNVAEFQQHTFKQHINNLQQTCLAIKGICAHIGIPLQTFLESIAISGQEIDINNRKIRLRFKAFQQQFDLTIFITRNGQDWSLLNSANNARLTP